MVTCRSSPEVATLSTVPNIITNKELNFVFMRSARHIWCIPPVQGIIIHNVSRVYQRNRYYSSGRCKYFLMRNREYFLKWNIWFECGPRMNIWYSVTIFAILQCDKFQQIVEERYWIHYYGRHCANWRVAAFWGMDYGLNGVAMIGGNCQNIRMDY